MINVLAFYKFVELAKPQVFKKKLLTFCKSLDIKGRILLGTEGINGSVAGTFEQTEKFKTFLTSDERFADIVFKEQGSISIPFRRMSVKIKDEIVRLGKKVDLSKMGTFVSPKEFLDVYNQKDVIILDTRNNYEWKVGKFKNALTLDIKTFREFPDAVEKLGIKKDAKIAMYCTGGIRCEKASAYMGEQGFTNVSQLKGGIITFGKELPDTAWEGSCFVFDKRLISDINSEHVPLTNCENCETKCDLYRNCRQVDCDRYVILCPDCDIKLHGCCSKECFTVMKSRLPKDQTPLVQSP